MCEHRERSSWVYQIFVAWISIRSRLDFNHSLIVWIKSSSLDPRCRSIFQWFLRSDRSSNFVHKRVRYVCSNIDFVVWRILYDTFVSTSVPYTLRVTSILTLASLADEIEISIEWVSYIRINNKFSGVILFRITFSLRGLQFQKDHRFLGAARSGSRYFF